MLQLDQLTSKNIYELGFLAALIKEHRQANEKLLATGHLGLWARHRVHPRVLKIRKLYQDIADSRRSELGNHAVEELFYTIEAMVSDQERWDDFTKEDADCLWEILTANI